MTNRAFFGHLLALILFYSGASLAFIENGSELSLWVQVFGVLLSLLLHALAWLGNHSLRVINPQKPVPGRVATLLNFLSIGLGGFSFLARFFLRPLLFVSAMVLALLCWLLAFFTFLRSYPPQSE